MSDAAAYLSQNDLTRNEIQLIIDGRLLESIKAVRERTGLGLRESKELVESYRDMLPKANFTITDRDKRILEMVDRMSSYIECNIENFLEHLLHQMTLESDRRVMECRARNGRKILNRTLKTGRV